ncbi:MAG: hypothetical protein V7724_07300 [Sediminicola sp.]
MKNKTTIVSVLLVLAISALFLYLRNHTEIVVYNPLPYTARVTVRYTEKDSTKTRVFTLRSGARQELAFTGISKDAYSFHFNPAHLSDIEFREYTRQNSPQVQDSVIFQSNLAYPVWSDMYKTGSYSFPLASPRPSDDYTLVSFEHVKFTRKLIYKKQGMVFLMDPVFPLSDSISGRIKANTIAADELQLEVLRWKSDLWENYRKEGRFTVVNVTAYKVRYVMKYPSSSFYRSKSEGYFYLGPGERKEFSVQFLGETPSFQVSANTVDRSLVKFGTDGETTEIMFQGTTGTTGPVHSEHSFAYEYRKGELPSGADSEVHFSQEIVGIYDTISNSFKANYYLLDKANEYLLSAEGNSEEDYLNNVQEACRDLNRSFTKQLAFSESHFERCRYNLGMEIADKNNKNMPGVWIEKITRPINLLSQQVPFIVGDVILSINGTTIYSPADFAQSIHDHAVIRSIESPLKVIFQREDGIYSTDAVLFFNHDHSSWANKDERLRAFFIGAANGFFLGFADNISRLSSNMDFTNDLYRLNEKYPSFSILGNIGGAVLSPVRLLFLKPVKNAVRGLGVTGGSARLVSNIALENGENFIYNAMGNRHPLTTYDEVKAQMKIDAVFSLGIGFGVSKLK